MGPVFQALEITLYIQKILETSAPLDAAKIISDRFLKECMPPEIFIAGKCIMFVGGVATSVSNGPNLLAVSGTMSADTSMIKDF